MDHRRRELLVSGVNGTPTPAPTTPPRDEIMEQFEFGHLPAGPMRDTSQMFSGLAEHVHETLPRCEERSVALRKLLEGKDAAVRAARKGMKR